MKDEKCEVEVCNRKALKGRRFCKEHQRGWKKAINDTFTPKTFELLYNVTDAFPTTTETQDILEKTVRKVLEE